MFNLDEMAQLVALTYGPDEVKRHLETALLARSKKRLAARAVKHERARERGALELVMNQIQSAKNDDTVLNAANAEFVLDESQIVY